MVNRITSGRITIDGRPAQSLHVKLFDRDSIELGPFNLNYRTTYLGEAHTNNDGFYSISYGPDSYGGGLDEDTIETKAAELPSLQHRFGVAAEYGPGHPDLLIEVYRGNTLVKTSEVADVSDEEFTLDVNIESGTPPERRRPLMIYLRRARTVSTRRSLVLASRVSFPAGDSPWAKLFTRAG